MSVDHIEDSSKTEFHDNSIKEARWLLGSVGFIFMAVLLLGVVATYTTT